MKHLLTLILGVLLFTQCNKTDDYCEIPSKVTGAFEFGSGSLKNPHDPTKLFKIYLQFESNTINIEKTLYSFSTPDCFINPKGDYTEDIVDRGEYTYVLKDTANPPDSVDVRFYTFNDCGKTEAFTTTIVYN